MLSPEVEKIVAEARPRGWVMEPKALRLLALAGVPVPSPLGSPRWEAGTGAQVLGQDGFSGDGISLVLPAASAAQVEAAVVPALRGGGVG